LGEPLGSAVLAIFILNEFPSPVVLWGGILILAGITLASSQQNKS
jgi:drug/metabolite transporter (DMT)-like permease